MNVASKKINPMAAAVIGALLCAPSAEAADTLPESIRACAVMRNAIERLACYDKAVAHIESGSAAPSAENMFGASTALAPEQKTERQSKDDELRQMSGTVVSVSRSESGLITLTLDNEQVWRQTDADATLTIESGDSVTISRASLGTFRLVDKRGRSSRFKRLR
jgi:hypothetical protein